MAFLGAAGLTGCASGRSAGEEGGFEELARAAVARASTGWPARRVLEVKVSPDKTIACGSFSQGGSVNVFAVMLDRPYPDHTAVEVKTLPDFLDRPDPETRRAVGKALLQSLREINAACSGAGVPLRFGR